MRRIVLVLLLLSPPLLAGFAASTTPAAVACPGYDHFDGVGWACPVEGGYEIVLDDGTRVFTHGPDPVFESDLHVDAAIAPPRDPVCIDDPMRDFHAHFIYAHPADKPNRGAELTPALRGLVREANGLLHLEGSEFGAPVQYRFLCDGEGEVHISVVTIPVATGLGDYRTLVNVLTAMGFVNGHAKYWVWYDDRTACSCGGIAAAPLDPERAPSNDANGGPLFGATYGYLSARIPMHENGHNLGAVADAAPDSSTYGHCVDGLDIMCYRDATGVPYRNDVCRDRQHFDCDHDTYFHPDPPPGTYLARKWNLGAPLNRFMQGCLYAEADILVPGASAEVAVPAECADHVYAIYGRYPVEATHTVAGAPPVNLHVNEFSVCWYAGATPLSCPANAKPWGHEGRVPAGADRAVVTRLAGDDGRFTLSAI